MNSAALYIRVSTTDQTEYSPEAQKKALLSYAKNNNLFVNPNNIFVDEGISGRKAEKRPAFMKMIGNAKLKPRPFDIILVHKFDRFARSREDSVIYKSMLLKECGIKVISITESIEDDKFSIILESMLEAMAEYYSINLGEEVKKGMKEKALRGELQNIASLGYKVENGRLVIVPEEASIVEYIFDQYLNFNLSFYKIAKNLNSMGVKTHRGNPIENRQVQYMLCNPVYCGYLRWTPTGKTKRNFDNPNTIISKGNHKAIISKETFDKVQEKIKSSKKKSKPKARPNTEYRHWLSSLVYCDNCKSTLIYMNLKVPAFQCGGYSKGKCKISHYISVKKLEKIVLDTIKQDIDDISTGVYNLNIISPQFDKFGVQKLEEHLNKIKLSKDRAKQAYLCGIDSIEEYKKNKSILENEENDINKKIKSLKCKTKSEVTSKFSSDLKEIYLNLQDKNIDTETKSRAIKSIIKKIIFDKISIQIVYYS